jgi:hypothetical protein
MIIHGQRQTMTTTQQTKLNPERTLSYCPAYLPLPSIPGPTGPGTDIPFPTGPVGIPNARPDTPRAPCQPDQANQARTMTHGVPR